MTRMTHQATDSSSRSRSSSPIQSLSRAAAIMRALRDDNQGASLGQLAHRVNLPRSTVQRIVNALIFEGMVVSSGTQGGYRLGPEILLLANAMRKDMVSMLHPMLTALMTQVEETVDLAMMRNAQMVFIDQVEGMQRLRTVSSIGESFPMTVTANGKAALALLDSESVQQIAKSERNQWEKQKPIKQLKQEIESIQKEGFALDINEHTEGISAAGIAFAKGSDIYAVSIPAPTSRFMGKQELLVNSLLVFKKELVSILPDIRTI